MGGDELTICERCHESVDPDAPDVLRMAKRQQWESLGDSGWTTGVPALFHQRCAPRGGGWVVAP